MLVIAVCAVSLAVCCGLAWWQWQRFESANGTFQNLGYVLQWPLFGVAPAYMFWRMRRLRDREAAKPPQPSGAAGESEPDDELAAYNRYLARLDADQETR
ncbi:hypothetical protein SAMN05216174_101771 [Actinokineospora iranica]|uniref:DNA-binding transcriptional regulator of glucitol operon n=1 Tax=Actinokineospora iranica TaxID=1271860 RepID=A0A1G6K8E5_9PSEU|nr:hypothetical protein SAMN05216174_101771 [Actinokineospora iranica]